ncbi:MAG: NmrA family NAD(P)-binding protein [Pseudomonadota bacterium]
MSLDEKPVLVVGAGAPLGREIVRLLRGAGRAVIATVRTEDPEKLGALSAMGVDTALLDLTDAHALPAAMQNVGAAIFTPILTLSAAAARHLPPDAPAVFFSSNNVAIDPDDPVYASLLRAEETVRSAAPSAAILRPTMIYGFAGDGNLSRLAAAMRRYPLVPMPGRGRALQQPLFYKDLAAVAVRALDDPSFKGKTCAVAGPESISQKALYRAVAEAIDASVLIAPTPARAASVFIGLCERAGLRGPVKAAQLARASADKIPQGDNQVFGRTPLSDGLSEIAAAMKTPR